MVRDGTPARAPPRSCAFVVMGLSGLRKNRTGDMAQIDKDHVLQVLKRIAAPDGRGNLVSAGLVSDIAIDGSNVMFALTTDPAHARSMENLRGAVEKAVLAIPGVGKAMIALTAERPPQREPGPRAQA